MKRKIDWIVPGVFVFVFWMLCMPLSEASTEVSLKVLNPRGEITLPPISAPTPRIADLSGKKIAIYWNGKAGGDNLWNNVETLLWEELQSPDVVRYQGAFDLGDALAAKIARETDAFIYGVGD